MQNQGLRISLAIVISLFSICSFAGQLTADQVRTAQHYFFREPGTARNLHELQTRFSDGVKGFEIYLAPEQPVNGLYQYANPDERDLQASYCQADTVVRARAENQQVYPTAQTDSLFTTTKFVVTDVIKGSPDFYNVGKVLDVVRRGGELVDQGERLRVLVDGRPEFENHHEYLLFLTSTKAGEPLVFHADEYVTIGVDGDRLNISMDGWDGFHSGDSYNAARSRVIQLLTRLPCQT